MVQRQATRIKETRFLGTVFDNRFVRWGMPVLWMGAIYALSAQSRLPDLTPGAPGLQEVLGHWAVFGVLAALWWWALWGIGVPQALPYALLITVLYGALDEFHQSFVPNRVPSIGDWLVDLAGAISGLLILQTWLWRTRRQR